MNAPLICPRCHGVIVTGTYPQGQVTMVVDGKPHHFYCGWKIQQQEKENKKSADKKPELTR